MFKLSVPHPDMLQPNDLQTILDVMKQPEVSKVKLRAISESVRGRLNPHPAGQKEENVPHLDGEPLEGMQHKYRETVLFFPSEVCQPNQQKWRK
jgi:L-lysine 2,3-aminomutase